MNVDQYRTPLAKVFFSYISPLDRVVADISHLCHSHILYLHYTARMASRRSLPSVLYKAFSSETATASISITTPSPVPPAVATSKQPLPSPSPIKILPAALKSQMPFDLIISALKSFAITPQTVDIHVQVTMFDKMVRFVYANMKLFMNRTD